MALLDFSLEMKLLSVLYKTVISELFDCYSFSLNGLILQKIEVNELIFY